MTHLQKRTGVDLNHRDHGVAPTDDTSRSVDGAFTNKQPVLMSRSSPTGTHSGRAGNGSAATLREGTSETACVGLERRRVKATADSHFVRILFNDHDEYCYVVSTVRNQIINSG